MTVELPTEEYLHGRSVLASMWFFMHDLHCRLVGNIGIPDTLSYTTDTNYLNQTTTISDDVGFPHLLLLRTGTRKSAPFMIVRKFRPAMHRLYWDRESDIIKSAFCHKN